MKRRWHQRVQCGMSPVRSTLPVIVYVLAVCTAAPQLCRASGSDFTAFAEDEDICRRVGTTAISGASGPSAARQYDVAYRQCMVAHIRIRQMNANGAVEGYAAGNPHSFEYPDAFYSIPYATPGYGYDGFSY